MTPGDWIALAVGAVFLLLVGGGMLALRLMEGAADPVRPLGWQAAMAELDAPPELPVAWYGDEALAVELQASTVELERLTGWLRDEPRDLAAAAKIRSLLPRHRELTAEANRRIEGLSAKLVSRTVNEWRALAANRDTLSPMAEGTARPEER